MDWLQDAIERAGGVAAVAAAAGVSDAHLYNLLSGHRRLTPKVAAKLAPALPRVPKRRWVASTMGDAFTKKGAAPVARIQGSDRSGADRG